MIKIVDCTLRDGGYYTNWDFEREVVDVYIDTMNRLPVDIIEIGYRNLAQSKYMGKYAYCPVFELERIRDKVSKKKISIMLDEKGATPREVDALIKPIKDLVDMVRIAVDPQNVERAVLLTGAIKQCGVQVGLNLMYMSKWRENVGFMEHLNSLNSSVDILFLVDSFGGVLPNDVKEMIAMIRANCSLPLGFHGHDNINMSLANALAAVETGIEYLDATILGMGRGAGNLKQELLLTVLNKHGGLEVDFNALGNVVTAFEPLHQKHGWGTSLPYMISGVNSFPQKEVMEWTCNRVYSLNSIVRALENKQAEIGAQKKYPFFEGATVENVLVVGGGGSLKSHVDGILKFIENKMSIAIIFASAKNAGYFLKVGINQYYCLMGKEGLRLEKVLGDEKCPGVCVVHPRPRQMGIEVPISLEDVTYELKEIGFTNSCQDSCTALALQTALDLGAKHVYLTGNDGYADVQGANERTLALENEHLFEDYHAYSCCRIVSLVPTMYRGVTVESVYQKL